MRAHMTGKSPTELHEPGPWSAAPTASSARTSRGRCWARRGGAGAGPAVPALPTSAARGALVSTCSGSATKSSWSRPTCATPTRSGGGRRLRLRLPPGGADDRRGRAGVPAGDARGQRAGRLERLRGLPEHGVARVVFASSDKAYGSSPSCPTARTSRCEPPTPTMPARRRPTSIARSYAKAYGLPLAVTRFANVYGGGDLNFSRLIPETAVAVLEGRPPVIRSDGSPERDFLHVDDAVSAYLAIAGALDGRRRGGGFNAGGERPHSVREVVDADRRGRRRSVEPDFQGDGNPDGEIDRQFVDSTKLRELTGWRPEVDLEDGLRSTLDWYREHPQARPGSSPPRHVRALHGHGQGHEDDRRPLPGRAGKVAGAQLVRRGAAADGGAGEESRIGAGALQRGADPGGADGARLARSRGGGAGRARGAADALGPGAALGQGPQGRLPDDQRQSREPHLEPRLLTAGRQVPPPLPDRRRRLLRVDGGRGPQAAAPALALHGRRRRALCLRRPLHAQGVGGPRGPWLRGRLALQLHDRHHDPERASSPRCTTGCRRSCPTPRPRRPGFAPTSRPRTRSRCARRCRHRGWRAPRPTRS